jgi:type IV fimbrial biogenesis protein FimT
MNRLTARGSAAPPSNRRQRTGRPHSRGLTLTECLVAISATTTLTVLAAPSFIDMLDGVRQREVAGSLHDALLLARSEAIKANARVVICGSVDGQRCAASGAWDQGWIIFRDADNDAQISTGEAMLDVRGPISSGWRLMANQPFASYVSFKPDGRAAYRSGGFQAGTFTVCRAAAGAGAVKARQLVLSSSGRPRVERVTLPSCQP